MICTGGRTCQGRPLVCKGLCNPRYKHHAKKIKWATEGRPASPEDSNVKSDRIPKSIENIEEPKESPTTIPSVHPFNSTQIPLSMSPLSRMKNIRPPQRTRYSTTQIYWMSFVIYLTINTLMALLAWNEPIYHVFLCTQIMGIVILSNWAITGTLPIIF